MVVIDRPAEGNTFGPAGCCRYADSSTHTWLDSSTSCSGGPAWRSYVRDSFAQDFDPTSLNTAEVD